MNRSQAEGLDTTTVRESGGGPTLTQLRALVAVADTLHFGDAAALLGLSQPAVSAAVSALERSLGAALVERTTRRVLLTATGALVAERARVVLTAVDDLAYVAGAGSHPLAGPLRLGVIPSIAPYLLPAVIGGLARRQPDLQLDLTEEQTGRLLLMLGRGHVDAVVIATDEDPRSFVEQPLYREDFVLAVPGDSPLAGTADVDSGLLPDLDLMLLAEGHCLRDQVLDLCPGAGRPGHGAHATSLATLSQLVAHGFGATLLPATTVALHAAQAGDSAPGLGIATLTAPAPGRTVRLVHRLGAARSEGFVALAGLLRDCVGEAGLPVEILPGP